MLLLRGISLFLFSLQSNEMEYKKEIELILENLNENKYMIFLKDRVI